MIPSKKNRFLTNNQLLCLKITEKNQFNILWSQNLPSTKLDVVCGNEGGIHQKERMGKEREGGREKSVQYGKSKEMVIDRRRGGGGGVRDCVSRTWLFKKNSAKEERTRAHSLFSSFPPSSSSRHPHPHAQWISLCRSFRIRIKCQFRPEPIRITCHFG